jgi:hypothetical protein
MSHAAAAGGAPPAAAAAGTATPGSVAATAAVREGWRPVVTAFVQRRDGRVLVVKRSDKARRARARCPGEHRPSAACESQRAQSTGPPNAGRRQRQDAAAHTPACNRLVFAVDAPLCNPKHPFRQVSTYQGMWGGVSGGVEPADTSLLDRAHEEVRMAAACQMLRRAIKIPEFPNEVQTQSATSNKVNVQRALWVATLEQLARPPPLHRTRTPHPRRHQPQE